MAYCEVTVSDIYNKVSEEITSTFPDYKIREDGNIFIPQNNGNKNFLGSQLKKTVTNINKEYLSFKHGNVVNVYKEPYGYIVDISPKQELADAMTAQNYRDEVGESNTNNNNQIKLRVAELFESNPELANVVYEVVGITQTPKEVVQDLSGNTYSVNESDIITYETDYGPVRYITDENGDMVMLSDKNTDVVKEGSVLDNFNLEVKLNGRETYHIYTDGSNKVASVSFVEHTDNSIEILGINVEDSYRRRGIAYEIYKKLNEKGEVYTEQNFTYSLKNSKNERIAPAKLLWDKLIKEGKAIKTTKPFNDGLKKNIIKMLPNKSSINNTREEITPQQKQQAQQLYAQYLEQNPNGTVEGFKNWINNNQSDVQYQLPQGREQEEYVASEKTIRDLAARMSDRIGIPVRFESDRTKKYKGKLENGTAVVNLAYATLDTPIHEILGHPIIRAIKNRDKILSYNEWVEINTAPEMQGLDIDISREAYDKYVNWRNNTSKLYQNLLKELETGRGKEVFDRIKRDYVYKERTFRNHYVGDGFTTETTEGETVPFSLEEFKKLPEGVVEKVEQSEYLDITTETINIDGVIYEHTFGEDTTEKVTRRELPKYTLEEQQEEALVELLGLYTAEKLDKVKDGKLISLLKRLLKEMKAFMKQLLGQREVEIDKLPDNMTLGDIADLLAYSNSKLILPGNEVVYTTPDNQQFKTYQEASNHISDLTKSVEDVDLSDVKIITYEDYLKDNKVIDGLELQHGKFLIKKDIFGRENVYFKSFEFKGKPFIVDEEFIKNWLEKNNYLKQDLRDFIDKNKEYEQSREIIEEWKKVNNIQYNPEEVYSRGQEFVSVVGAYSDFDVNLMMQNLLQHIEDNQKAGGEFTISAFTKPVDRSIRHLEGGGGKIKFKIYPQSQDIKWASNIDVYSGSVWDASEKVNKDKKSELLGVSYTKYPSLFNVNAVQPNLASIIDNLAHHHNELGISLTGNNFRLEYDEDIPYQTKKIIDSINSILDQKYGKLVKPEITIPEQKVEDVYRVASNYHDDFGDDSFDREFTNKEDAQEYLNSINYEDPQGDYAYYMYPHKKYIDIGGIQPTQTNETLKESIDGVKNRITPPKLSNWRIVPGPGGKGKAWAVSYTLEDGGGDIVFFGTEKEAQDFIDSFENATGKEKEYTEQALINTRVARLKEVAKKYPRSLIRSEVRPISSSNLGFAEDELPFQKLSNSNKEIDETNFNSPHSRVDNSEQNSQEPISDNFVEYVQYKKQQLDNTKQDINRVKQDLRYKDTSTNRAKLKRLEEIQRNIENQLEQLGNNEVDYMFHAIDQDLDNLAEALSSSNLHEVDDVREKIEFYEKFFDSLVKMDHPSFAKLKEKSTKLKVDYGDLIKGKVIKMLENSPLIQKIIDNYKEEGKDITIEDLLKANADISWWDENLYGIISSSTGDTILPQFLFSEFNKELRRETESVQGLIDKLNAFLRRTGMKSFNWVQSETDGKKDGYLIDLFSNKWFSAWKERNRLLQNFRENLFSGADSKVLTNSYRKLMNWYESNTHFVDFTRLRIVKDIYGSNPEYSKYFTYSDEQMLAYEENLKKQLGPRYEDTVEMILNKLQKFDELKFETKEDGFKNRNIASSNIWEFLNQSKNREKLNNEYKKLVTDIAKSRKGSSEQKALMARQSEVLRLLSKPAGTIDYEYVAPDGSVKSSTVLFNKFDDLSILPKSTKMENGEKVDSGFYSKEYQDMLKDPEKVEYWSILKEMSDYINSTYAQDPFNRLSYPKVEQEYAERLLNDVEFLRSNPGLKSLGRLFGNMAHEYKSWFFEKGKSKNDESDVRSNYSDKSESEIRHKAIVYQIKGMSKEDAYKRARAEVIESYSDIDLNTSMKATLIEASLHNARLKTEPIAKGILKVFSDIKDKDGKDRTRANERLKYWVDKIVLNHTTAYRGSTNLEGKPIDNEGWLNKIIQQLGGNKWLEKIQEKKLMKLLSDNDKKILKELKDVQKSGYGPTFKIDHLGYQLQKVIDADGNSQYAANGEVVTKGEFDKIFEQYIEDHIKSLGLDLNLAGIIDGVLKTVIFKGLGLNPISGIFNRVEGKHSSMIMDLTGEYWTTGNIDIANQFMFAANINKMSPDQLPVNIRGRKQEVKTFQEFINRLRVLQDRKNELQRNVEDSRFNMQKLNLFQFAVEHPEFKNQGAIMLAIMMDEDIVDNNGNKFKLFDKDTMSFTPFTLDNYGVLQIKPEFSESFTFNSEQIENMVLRIEDAVSHSQGNYNQFDIMKIKKSMWGRAATVFMTWFPEHFNQRWGVRNMNGDLNVNLFTGKKRQDGRFIAAYKTSKPTFFMYMLGALGISYGALGMVGLVGAGAVGAFVYQKFLKKVTSDIGRDANHAKESVEFFRSILIETLNYPMRMVNTSYRPGKIVEDLTGGKVYSKTNLSDEQIGSLRAMSRELAIMLTWLSIKLAMGALMYDDDDDKDSPARMRYNFIQNQLSRFITTLNSWGNPHALIEDNSRIAALSYVESLWKFLDVTVLDHDSKQIPKAALDISPLPRIITKPLQGQAPWEDKSNYDNDPNINLKGLTPTLKWTETLYKDWDTDGEYTAKKEYNEIRNTRRKEIKKDLMSKYGSNKHVIKAITDIKMEQEFGKKQKDMTYAEALSIIEDGEPIPKQKTKSGRKSKTNFRVKLRKKLRTLGLSQEEIDEILDNEFGN